MNSPLHLNHENWPHGTRHAAAYAPAWPVVAGLIGACIALALPYVQMPDEARILDEARHLLATGEFLTFGTDVAFEMPGAAFWYAILGANITAIRIANALLIPVQCWCIARIGARAFDRETGLIAGCAWAFWPAMLLFEPRVLSEAPFVTLFLGMLALEDALAIAALGALAVYTKGSLTILPAILVFSAAKVSSMFYQPRLAAAAYFLAFLCPWWCRNAYLLHALAPFTTSASWNWWSGHLLAVGVTPVYFTDLPEVARSDSYFHTTLAIIRMWPLEYVGQCTVRAVRFLGFLPIGIRGWLTLPVAMLAYVGVWSTLRQWRTLWPLYVVFLYFLVLHSLTLFEPRYRLPVEPIMILFAVKFLRSIKWPWSVTQQDAANY